MINGGVMGAGAANGVSAVRWGVARSIAVAWVLTLPASALIGAAVYGITPVFGTGALGPMIVTVMSVSLIAALFARRAGRGAPVEATSS